jgi:MoxR-like ATPase
MSENWQLFQGNGQKLKNAQARLENLETPPWRKFGKREDVMPDDDQRWQKIRTLGEQRTREKSRGKNFRLYSQEEINQTISGDIQDVINGVNAAIYLRRPLLVRGSPGTGKSSLAYAIAHELNLGSVLSWPITGRSNLQDGLYRYDAIGRLQDSQAKEEKPIGEYITLGPLGTAFLPSKLPRVLLIDEIDKSDINLPNDLLNLLEEGQFPIPELVRRAGQDGKKNSDQTGFRINTQDAGIDVLIPDGWVRCYAFPIIVMTTNGERDFPPAFNRRCLRVTMPEPQREALQAIVKTHFGEEKFAEYNQYINQLISEFLDENKPGMESRDRSTDQLLNTIHILTGIYQPQDEEAIKNLLLKRLSANG